jgi:hypothetical protein
MRASRLPVPFIALTTCFLLLAGCGSEPEPEAEDTAIPEAIAGAQAGPAQAVEGQRIGTPNEERVVTLGVLNKRNNLTQDLVMKPGQARRLGNLVVRVATCEKTMPWERPQEEGAFVQVFVEDRRTPDEKLAWQKVFSGWLFKNSPALNVVEHPVYDVWVKKCEMDFPGQEASPAAAASSSRAANASGSASAPSSEPSPAATASPSDVRDPD